MSSIIALDIETTGVDPQKDAIIEIGAVKFNQNRIEDEWSALINPGVPIPPFVSQLTGISSQMVAKAPFINEVIGELEHFSSDFPILGHNVRFDLSFLRKHDLFRYVDAIDTYDMASVLLPKAGRYNLGALAQLLGIPAPTQHRALADAHITYGIYTRLFDIAQKLPYSLINEIVRLGENIEWGAGYFFQKALCILSPQKPTTTAHFSQQGPIYITPPPLIIEPLIPNKDIQKISIDEASSYLEQGGSFSLNSLNFESRTEQIQLCQRIAQALSSEEHLLAEAGTGIGKSFAYLIPAALWSLKNNNRVVISTNTINLQDQLTNKDIPDVNKILDKSLKFAVLKGRNNYLCPRKLEALRKKGPDSPEEMRILAKMLTWLMETETGDLSEVNITGPIERAVWSRISAADEGCTSEACVRRMGGICPFYRAKQAAQQSNLLIVNHALLLADVATGNRVLPDYDYLIIDEAHHLESATTEALSFKVTQTDIERTIRDLGGVKSGILGFLLLTCKNFFEPGQLASLSKHIQKTTDRAFQFQNYLTNFFSAIFHFLEEQREGRPIGNYSQQVRITEMIRTLPHWEEIELAWEEANKCFDLFLQCIELLIITMNDYVWGDNDDIEDLLTDIKSLYRNLLEFHSNINGIVFEPEVNKVYWFENNPQNNQLTLEAAPLHVGELMEKYLWHEKKSIILTSATLASKGDFEYIRSRMHANDANEIALGSPYDYASSTLIYIPDNIPDPNERIPYQKAVNQGLVALCTATQGRALALFTSYSQLQNTSHAISGILSDAGIVTFEQGQGVSPHSLLESFKASDRAVLLGTRAFWEGVDVPGDSLSVLAIIRLPFSVPTDPIVAARAETFDDPFYDYTIPEAILTFRQGFGRLIRSHKDRGIVTIFDNRVLTKQYGRFFLESLPPCTVEIGKLEDLPRAAVRWLGF